MDFVAIDIGASNTRYAANDTQVRFAPNLMTDVPINFSRRIDPLDDSLENNLDITIIKENGYTPVDGENYKQITNYPVRLLVGEMSMRYGEGKNPSLQMNKARQPINYWSGIIAIALSKMYDKSLSEDISLFVAFPPAEVLKDSETIIREFMGDYTVKFNKLNTEVKFKLSRDNMYIYEESRLALIRFLTGPEHASERDKYLTNRVLSLDIGASTTDIVIFENGKFVDKSGQTFKIGCNIARAHILDRLNEEFNGYYTIETGDIALREGRIPDGAEHQDVREIVCEGKKKVAKEIINNLDPYFSKIKMPLSSIGYIIVSGGGSMVSSYIDADTYKPVKTVDPMSSFITSELKGISEKTHVVDYGDEPRQGNINGLISVAIATKARADRA